MDRKGIILLVLGMLLSVTVVNAQRQGNGDFEKRVAEFLERRADRLADDLGLEGEAKTSFKETYKNFQQELMAVMAASREQRTELDRKKIDDLTDEEATQRVKTMFDRKTENIVNLYNRLEIEKKYYNEFAKTMTNKQLLKIFEQGTGFRNQRNSGYRQNNRFGGGQGFGGQQGGFGGDFDGGFGDN